jgi:hypothetical protein
MFLNWLQAFANKDIKAAESGEFLLPRASRNMGRLR